jgi:hypothetical protein
MRTLNTVIHGSVTVAVVCIALSLSRAQVVRHSVANHQYRPVVAQPIPIAGSEMFLDVGKAHEIAVFFQFDRPGKIRRVWINPSVPGRPMLMVRIERENGAIHTWAAVLPEIEDEGHQGLVVRFIEVLPPQPRSGEIF